jgi:hypothetical protein
MESIFYAMIIKEMNLKQTPIEQEEKPPTVQIEEYQLVKCKFCGVESIYSSDNCYMNPNRINEIP